MNPTPPSSKHDGPSPSRAWLGSVWRVTAFIVVFVIGFVLLTPLDRPVYRTFAPIDTGEEDWHRMLRVVGYFPVWVIVALSMALIDSARRQGKRWIDAMYRPVLLLSAVAVCAGLAEAMKLIARRERPNMNDGLYIWRDWSDGPLHSGGFGLPSSHTMVAFAAAWVLCHLWPRASIIWLGLAVGCAVTRVINHSHFLTDVWTSALLSFVVVRTLWWWHTTHGGSAIRGVPAAEDRA